MMYVPSNLHRTLFFLLFDIGLIVLAVYSSFLLRFDFTIGAKYLPQMYATFIMLVTLRVGIFAYFGLYKVSWRYFSFRDTAVLVYLLVGSTLIWTLFVVGFPIEFFKGYPRSTLPIEFFVALFLLLSMRTSKRLFLELFYKQALGEAALIVATPDRAEEITRSLHKDMTQYWPVAIWDDSRRGLKINGVLVKSYKDIKEQYDGLKTALVSSEYDISTLYEDLNALGIANIKIFGQINDTLQRSLKDVTVEDLLARRPKDLDKAQISAFIEDKTVLITGAGGSIGSEIARQCVYFKAKQIILLDHSELNLYTISQELENENCVSVMQNVVNKEDITHTLLKFTPNIVIHAAAYKHVPLVEENIPEAIRNNVLGTKNIIDCSIECGVEKVLLISTDKAVRPTNVMGTTKRICELYAQNVEAKHTKIVAVRFGNVLGSSGSVIPKFKQQIEQGGPITVTHPDITRYFMLIPEACELVLQAATLGEGGEVFILDMGKPVKIVDLAKKLIELSARQDIDIVFSGLRPGEKLYEELLIEQSDGETRYPSITVAKSTTYEIKKLNDDIIALTDTKKPLEVLQKIVPEFNHQTNV